MDPGSNKKVMVNGAENPDSDDLQVNEKAVFSYLKDYCDDLNLENKVINNYVSTQNYENEFNQLKQCIRQLVKSNNALSIRLTAKEKFIKDQDRIIQENEDLIGKLQKK